VRSPDVVEEALHTGASGYIAKIDAARELLPAIAAVLKGEQFIGARLAKLVSESHDATRR
jgi:DNA-binding NarL/FixJ family response regulator